ncbi:hypothetical protein WH96_15675 [Kiloniella spongiae]|uniref:Secreted protein n=1 Tax=Kiloniella spongiae TaxID=1489064 RepID=A0A0H2MC93_9PROT|nr:hypothetical protein [Kiloniella spongiae]KLN59821.1 hypothetical protein WH96_15675 [Kiloniella spongiae]
MRKTITKKLNIFNTLLISVSLLSSLASANDQKPALHDTSQKCTSDRYLQPIGQFAVDVYCDDALGTNISIVKLKFDAPIVGPYTTTRRTWQGGDWAFSITSFMWGTDKKSLYVATEGYNGTGKAYYLDVETQTIQEIWSMSSGDCGSVLKGMDKKTITLENIPCSGNKAQEVKLPIPTN